MHVRPWEIDLMTYEQFERACQAIDEYTRRLKAASEVE